jgi:hypothetical protein
VAVRADAAVRAAVRGVVALAAGLVAAMAAAIVARAVTLVGVEGTVAARAAISSRT